MRKLPYSAMPRRNTSRRTGHGGSPRLNIPPTVSSTSARMQSRWRSASASFSPAAASRSPAYSLIVSSSRYRASPAASPSSTTSDLSISEMSSPSTASGPMASSEHTCSAMSRFQPENVASRRSSICSSESSSSKLQSTVARSVCCRSGAVRSPELSSWNRSRSRSAICSTDSARTRAADSSMPSGMPSSVRHSRATDAVFSDVSVNPGRAPAARAANSRTASWAASSVLGASSGGRSSGGTRHTVSPRTRSGSRLVAMICSHGHRASSSCTSVAQSLTWCSHVSRISSMCRERSASASVCASGTPCSSRTPRVVATACATGPCQSASSTSHASSRSPRPSSGFSPESTSRASRTASRVLPIPPRPLSVSARTSPSSLASSARSRSRPMKLFGSAGRLPVSIAVADCMGPLEVSRLNSGTTRVSHRIRSHAA